MLKDLNIVSSKIDRISRFIIIAFFILAFVATVYQVFSRFVLQSSLVTNTLPMIDFTIFNLTWIEELIRYLFVWIVFLGIGTVYKNKGHASVEILHTYLPEKWKARLSVLVEIINSALFIFMILYGYRILKFTSLQISPSMSLNMSWIYCSVLVFSVICLVHSLANLQKLYYKTTVKGQNTKNMQDKTTTV